MLFINLWSIIDIQIILVYMKIDRHNLLVSLVNYDLPQLTSLLQTVDCGSIGFSKMLSWRLLTVTVQLLPPGLLTFSLAPSIWTVKSTVDWEFWKSLMKVRCVFCKVASVSVNTAHEQFIRSTQPDKSFVNHVPHFLH